MSRREKDDEKRRREAVRRGLHVWERQEGRNMIGTKEIAPLQVREEGTYKLVTLTLLCHPPLLPSGCGQPGDLQNHSSERCLFKETALQSSWSDQVTVANTSL